MLSMVPTRDLEIGDRVSNVSGKFCLSWERAPDTPRSSCHYAAVDRSKKVFRIHRSLRKELMSSFLTTSALTFLSATREKKRKRVDLSRFLKQQQAWRGRDRQPTVVVFVSLYCNTLKYKAGHREIRVAEPLSGENRACITFGIRFWGNTRFVACIPAPYVA